jgi:hypothetical protein
VRVTLNTTVDSDVSPELIRMALLDFSDERPDIWPQLDPKTYQRTLDAGLRARSSSSTRYR